MISELTRNLVLADTVPNKTESDSPELLVGNDYYLDIIETEKIEVNPGLYLLSSKLGWIISGKTTSIDTTKRSCDMSMLILTHGNSLTENSLFTDVDKALPLKPSFEDFWNIESIGITDATTNIDDEKAMQNFKKTLKRENGRYQVTWPWKEEDILDLPEKRGLSLGRLKSLANKIQKQPEIMQRYNAIIKDQLKQAVIEKVYKGSSDRIKHYIPHHVVIKPEHETTKLRVVYDASAKVKKEYKSLNECLYRGPVLFRDLCV